MGKGKGREEEKKKERREAGKRNAGNASSEMGLKRGKKMLRNVVPRIRSENCIGLTNWKIDKRGLGG